MLVPDVLERTPPYVDRVLPGSPAEKAGVRPDDLILLLGDRLIQSCKALAAELEYIDYEDAVKLTVLRGQELIEFPLRSGRSNRRRRRKDNHDRHEDCRCCCRARCMAAVLPASSLRPPTTRTSQEQAAFDAAVDRVAPSVVRIETVGGLEQVDRVLFGTGPTTGLVVDPAGYIISSAFNFVNKPTSILVRLPDGVAKPAKLVATDHSRMLVLLKIDVGQAACRRARSSPQQRDARRPMGDCRGPDVRERPARTWPWASSARWTASGARRSRPTPPSRRTTTAARWSTSAAACWACSCRFRRGRRRNGRHRVVRFGHRLRHPGGTHPSGFCRG